MTWVRELSKITKLQQFINNIFASFQKNKAAADNIEGALLDLAIYDDCYPHPASGFRLEEISFLLQHIPNSKVFTSGSTYTSFNLPPELHKEHVQNLITAVSDLKNKIEIVTSPVPTKCRLFYCIFLNNIHLNISWLEKSSTPFAFTLYPGGGFSPGNSESDLKLKKVFSSPCFRKVIVTQKQTRNYLLTNGFCGEKDMLFVFGVVIPQSSLLADQQAKTYFKKDKITFDICFCAMKYTPLGEDKGYPIFIEFCKLMSVKYDFLRFHVIGGFDKHVIDVCGINEKIHFYGVLNYDRLKQVFINTDLIISPNEPGKANKGAFDLFPLGTVIEAALNEVVVMLTDPFEENDYFTNGEELLLIKPDVDEMIAVFESAIADIDKFYEVAKRGKAKFRSIYSNEYQLKPRINLLNSLIKQETAMNAK